ncbi:MAG: hypothetical protein K9H64_19030 [Bacteroidales bacterium]|nr:hypothetical protein [Bacteroidales bacterium]MCF8458132.1 hypothetical protein [Bacteroidales bacterium]
MKRTFFLLLQIILIAFHGYAQSDTTHFRNGTTLNPRKQHPNGFKITLGGPALGASISNSAFINPCGQIEVGLGYIGLYGGYKHHWNGREPKNWTSYSGAAFSVNLFILDYLGTDGYYNFDEYFRTNYVLYLPAYGIN